MAHHSAARRQEGKQRTMGIKGLLKALNPLLVPAEGSGGAGAGGTSNSHGHGHHVHHGNRNNGHGQPHAQPKGQGTNGKYHIAAFESTTVAVDASSWLYRAGYACADLLVESIETGQRSPQAEAVVGRYVTGRIDGLLAGAKVRGVILVFDGRRCPLKAGTNREREARRRTHLAEARRLRAAGRHAEARDRYKHCLKATDEMARAVAAQVQETYGRKAGRPNHFGVVPRVRCVFAPYEADAQLAKLCVDGVADAVITEDSDILVYSAAVGVAFPVIYKLDKDTGLCDVVSMDWLLSASASSASSAKSKPTKPKPLGERKSDRLAPVRRYLPPYGAQDGTGDKQTSGKSGSGSNSGGSAGKTKKKSSSKRGKGGGGTDGPMLAALRSMVNLEERKPGAGRRAFVQSCVLAGCDYAPSLVAGVGTVGAFKQVKENRNRDESVRFRRILMPFRGKIQAYAEEESDKEEAKRQTEGGGDDGGTGSNDSEDGPTSEGQSSVSTHKSKSRKDKEMESLNVYENLLAKSEAVFYYHCVLDVSNGKNVHLTEPQETALGEDGNASAASSRRPSKLSIDSLSDDQDSASTTTVTTVASSSAATLDPRKFHPSMKRFEGDISFVGSLDVSPTNYSVGTFPTRKATAKTPLSSLTRAPSAGPVSNPYASSSSDTAPSSAPPATSGMVRIREKTSKGSTTIDALFNAAAAKKSPTAAQSQQQQGKESSGSNMFAGFAHGDKGALNSGTEEKVICVDDDGNDQSDIPVPTAEAAGRDDPAATSRHFSSKPTSGEKRKVSFDDTPEKKDEATEAASSPSPAKKTKKDATNRSPASDGSGFWSDGDNDCIVVDEPPPKSKSGSGTMSNSGARMSFASAHQSHSSAAPEKALGGKQNTGNAPSSATSGFISVFQSSRMDRIPRGSGKKSKSKTGSGKSQKGKSGSGGLLQGFERQRKNAAADGSSVIKETLEDRQRRLSNASRRSSTSSAGSRSKSSASTGGGKKRKSTGSLSGFFGPLDFSRPTRKSL